MNTRLTPFLPLTVALLLGVGAPVQAREEFPRVIASHLSAPLPPCSICHQYGKTGGDTLVTPFAWGMRARGLSGQETSLTDALDRVQTDGVDSDGDGTGDVDELIAGTDPNSATSNPALPGTVSDPQLGCTMAGGPARGTAGLGWLLLSAGLLAIRRPRPQEMRLARKRSRRGCHHPVTSSFVFSASGTVKRKVDPSPGTLSTDARPP